MSRVPPVFLSDTFEIVEMMPVTDGLDEAPGMVPCAVFVKSSAQLFGLLVLWCCGAPFCESNVVVPLSGRTTDACAAPLIDRCAPVRDTRTLVPEAGAGCTGVKIPPASAV